MKMLLEYQENPGHHSAESTLRQAEEIARVVYTNEKVIPTKRFLCACVCVFVFVVCGGFSQCRASFPQVSQVQLVTLLYMGIRGFGDSIKVCTVQVQPN